MKAPLRPAATRLALEGMGVPVGSLLILQRDDRGRIVKTPYREWRRSLGVAVECPRCNVDRAIIDKTPCVTRDDRMGNVALVKRCAIFCP